MMHEHTWYQEIVTDAAGIVTDRGRMVCDCGETQGNRSRVMDMRTGRRHSDTTYQARKRTAGALERIASSDEYQGWTNRETWAANLWLTSTQGLYNATLAIVRESRADGVKAADGYGLTVDENTGVGSFESYMVENLDDLVETYLDDPRDGTPDVLLRDIGSLWRVNWREIYAGLLEHIED